MNKRTLFLSVLTVLAISVQAKVKLPHIICDNMVLQQQTDARLWGWAKAGQEVKVTASWDGKTVKTKADADGKWLVKVATARKAPPKAWVGCNLFDYNLLCPEHVSVVEA